MVRHLTTTAVEKTMAMLYLAAYMFLLRVPSEGLLMARGGDGCSGPSAITLEDAVTVAIALKSRKNRQGGVTLRRKCSCRNGGTRILCPVHALWHDFFSHLPVGTQPWAQYNSAAVRKHIRAVLSELEVHWYTCCRAIHVSACACSRCQILNIMARMTFGEATRKTCRSQSFHWHVFAPSVAGSSEPVSTSLHGGVL